MKEVYNFCLVFSDSLRGASPWGAGIKRMERKSRETREGSASPCKNVQQKMRSPRRVTARTNCDARRGKSREGRELVT